MILYFSSNIYSILMYLTVASFSRPHNADVQVQHHDECPAHHRRCVSSSEPEKNESLTYRFGYDFVDLIFKSWNDYFICLKHPLHFLILYFWRMEWVWSSTVFGRSLFSTDLSLAVLWGSAARLGQQVLPQSTMIKTTLGMVMVFKNVRWRLTN